MSRRAKITDTDGKSSAMNGAEAKNSANAAHLYWLERFNRISTTYGKVQNAQSERNGFHEPPRVDEAEAIRDAAELADKFNKIFLRTLRALRDLRRYAPSVMIQNAGQVNIGTQQVNAAQVKR